MSFAIRSSARAALAPARTLLTGARAKHTLPELPYAYNALEPSISAQIMELHHSKHHATYVAGLNTAEESLANLQAKGDVKGYIKLGNALKFNGGGHINHSLFWKNLAPTGSEQTRLDPSSRLAKQINEDFGSLENLKKTLNATTAGIQGSGWGWLGYNTATKKLEAVTTANQDPLLTHVPIIGIDIWEHSFYLQYKNVKVDYLNAIWNVINFQEANKRLEAAM